MFSNFLKVTQQIRVWEESGTSPKPQQGIWALGDGFPRGNTSQRRRGASEAERPASHGASGAVRVSVALTNGPENASCSHSSAL